MIWYSPEDGSVRVELPRAEVITIDGLEPGQPVTSGDNAELRAVFLSRDDAEVLGKMIQYTLDKVKVRAQSKDSLAGLLPRVSSLFGE